MGQRTQMFIREKNTEGEISNHFYHQQWGGGVGLLHRLNILRLKLYGLKYGEKGLDYDSLLNKNDNIFNYFDIDEKMLLDDKEISIPEIKTKENFTKEELIDLLSYGDNDDGFLLLNVDAKNHNIDATFLSNDFKHQSFIDSLKSYYGSDYKKKKEDLELLCNYIENYLGVKSIPLDDFLLKINNQKENKKEKQMLL